VIIWLMGITTNLTMLMQYGDPVLYLQSLWVQFISFLPHLVGALLVLIIGWVVAVFIGMLVRRVIHFTGIDGWAERSSLNRRLRLREGSKYALVSNFVASIVKWVIILGTIGLAADMLGARETGLEPATPAVTGRCSNQIELLPQTKAF
jgi:small-conductance mechanosensitive channel